MREMTSTANDSIAHSIDAHPSSLGDVLEFRASSNPDGLAYAFLAGNNAMTQWTYADLLHQVGKVMSALDSAGSSGAPALLVRARENPARAILTKRGAKSIMRMAPDGVRGAPQGRSQ